MGKPEPPWHLVEQSEHSRPDRDQAKGFPHESSPFQQNATDAG